MEGWTINHEAAKDPNPVPPVEGLDMLSNTKDLGFEGEDPDAKLADEMLN